MAITREQFQSAATQLRDATIAKITEFEADDTPTALMSRLHAIRSLVENYPPSASSQAHIAMAIAKLTEDISAPKR